MSEEPTEQSIVWTRIGGFHASNGRDHRALIDLAFSNDGQISLKIEEQYDGEKINGPEIVLSIPAMLGLTTHMLTAIDKARDALTAG